MKIACLAPLYQIGLTCSGSLCAQHTGYKKEQ